MDETPGGRVDEPPGDSRWGGHFCGEMNMAIQFACPCGKPLQARDDFAGRKMRCPACGSVLTIPSPGGSTPSIATAASVGSTPATPMTGEAKEVIATAAIAGGQSAATRISQTDMGVESGAGTGGGYAGTGR